MHIFWLVEYIRDGRMIIIERSNEGKKEIKLRKEEYGGL